MDLLVLDLSARDQSVVDLRVVDLVSPPFDATPDIFHDVPDLRDRADLTSPPPCDGGLLDRDAGACVACLVAGDCVVQNATPACRAGACAIASCNAGWGDCNKSPVDGCETDTNRTLAACGGCGMACPLPRPNTSVVCTNGVCIDGGCLPGFGDCDGNAGNGCEKNVSSDPANCGACGVACKQGEACVMGACVSCAAGRYEGPAMATALGVNVSGTISFTLGAPVNNVLTVTKGSLSMTGMLQASATATVTGSLDCNKKAFTGMLTNGVAMAQGLPPTPFTGSLTADYLGNAQSFTNGTMSVQGLGNGTWTAAYLGP